MTEPQQDATPRRHAVADLLTDEMRDRVRAATFYRLGPFTCAVGLPVCPLGVALGLPRSPGLDELFRAFGVGSGSGHAEARRIIESFVSAVDTGTIAPEEVKPLLGIRAMEDPHGC